MTVLMNRLFGFAWILILSGCASSIALVNTKGVDQRQISLCDIFSNFERYLGAKVELNAHYISDGKHEEVLEDINCLGGRRIIDIGRRNASPSVTRFYAERKRICSERGASYLCNTSAEVEVLGTIRVMSGDFVLDIDEFEKFIFDD